MQADAIMSDKDKEISSESRFAESLQRIEEKLSRLNDRQSQVEKTLYEKVPFGIPLHAREQNSSGAFAQQDGEPTPSPTRTWDAVGEISDLQGEFQAIKDTLQRIKLPSDLKLNDSRRGVKATDRPMFNQICKSARYVETALKLLGSIDRQSDTFDVDLQNLFLVVKAHIKSLQDEHAAVIVQGQFDQTTSRFFRSLQSNSSVFTPTALEQLRNAAAITAASQTHSQQGQNYQRSPYRGRPWGSRNRGRGGHDAFSSFYNRPFPTGRGRWQYGNRDRTDDISTDEQA